jgi:methyltransferase
MRMKRGLWWLCAAVGAQRLAELAWSRAHERRLARLGGRRVEERAFAWMAALHAAVLIAAPVESSLRRRRPPRALAIASGLALAAAAALRGWALASLGDAWSVRVIQFPDGKRPVIARGPYRFIRHPNYLAVIVELAALPLVGGAYGTALAATLANAALLARRIPLEERALFADARYRALMASKPRLWPRVSS